jgi:nudix-type nucleoside diphosphatase (YffH/AdpP family)
MTRIVASRQAYKGYATVTVITLDDGHGVLHHREVIDFGQSACVLPYDPARKVAQIVRLPRAPLLLDGISTPLIEAPAGMIDTGETPEAAAIREALEEVGLALASVELVAAAWPSPGVIAERSHLFLAAYGLEDRRGPGGGLAQEHEGILAEEMPLADLWRHAQRGELHDMKTFALTLALHARRPELFG